MYKNDTHLFDLQTKRRYNFIVNTLKDYILIFLNEIIHFHEIIF